MFKTIITNTEALRMSKRKCCNCGERKNSISMIIVRNTMAFCNVDCATTYAYKNKEKGKQIKHREQKKAFRLSDLKIRKAAAKKACHDYIRERDKNNPCICCGRPLGKKYDAGHFLESGNNPKIRYDENNIHAQSVHCNQYKGGDSGSYQENLRLKIGDEAVDKLLASKGGTVKRTADDYLEIEKYYKDKLKQLKENKDND